MRETRRCLMIAWIAFCCLSFFAPQIAQAQTADPSNIPTGANAPVTSTDCQAGNSIDATYFANKAANLQKHQQTIQTLHTLYPIANALTACVQNIMNIMQKMPNFANPSGIATAIITQLIVSVVNSTCSQIMGTITSIQTSLTNMTKICIPLPHFNGLDLPTFNAPSCSGGLVISPIQSWTANPPIIRTTINPNLK